MTKTDNCIVCLKSAAVHTGHVHDNDGNMIVAGWCEEHRDYQEDYSPNWVKKNCIGCFGKYDEKMGISTLNE